MSAFKTISTLGSIMHVDGRLDVHIAGRAWVASWRVSGVPYTGHGSLRVQCLASDQDIDVALQILAARMTECAQFEAERLGIGDEQDREIARELRKALREVSA